jgi:hypothetical protein
VVAVVSRAERAALLALLRAVRDDLCSFRSAEALRRVERAIAHLEAGRLGSGLSSLAGEVAGGGR